MGCRGGGEIDVHAVLHRFGFRDGNDIDADGDRVGIGEAHGFDVGHAGFLAGNTPVERLRPEPADRGVVPGIHRNLNKPQRHAANPMPRWPGVMNRPEWCTPLPGTPTPAHHMQHDPAPTRQMDREAMKAPDRSPSRTAYLLEGRQLAEVVDFVAELARRGVAAPEPKPALVNADGTRLEVPGPVFEALVQVATAMARGQGVTVMSGSWVMAPASTCPSVRSAQRRSLSCGRNRPVPAISMTSANRPTVTAAGWAGPRAGTYGTVITGSSQSHRSSMAARYSCGTREPGPGARHAGIRFGLAAQGGQGRPGGAGRG